MGDALNIEKLLNTGYFTSSRARSTDSSVAILSYESYLQPLLMEAPVH